MVESRGIFRPRSETSKVEFFYLKPSTIFTRGPSWMNFANTWNKLLKHWISVDFFLVEGYGLGALRKELHIAPFVEQFKTSTLGRSC